MLRLVSDSEKPVVPDTDFAFLSDSEEVPAGELRTVLHGGQPSGVATVSETLHSV